MSFQQLVDACQTDTTLAEAIKTSESIDGICALALQHGISVTPEEVIKGTAAITSELSDADLAGVAGGSWSGNEGVDSGLAWAGGVVGAGVAVPAAMAATAILIK
ncbi:Nif11-like leader peptide family natural product precursor [Synechococcus sp. CBW1002]|uniref:Nif11-like leader peptide family RiPP precursor n=1 Tax=Synechococcus sp. CBW1002 TaxID=1353134 RepID=UPI0018CC9584|nr:Nif11-like leader peptide family RiPP precursor [Synechococcus sp. CBW1002]QPN61373.1 Nif11-like leader peptide family natural product precursor [Synechococcus sp. CBW1002]